MIETTPQSTRTTWELFQTLRNEIEAGHRVQGEMMPSVRALSRMHDLSPNTVHKTLQQLAAAGYVVAEPRRGYRVIYQPPEVRNRSLIACVLEGIDLYEPYEARQRMQTALQLAVARSGGGIIVLDGRYLKPAQIESRLREANPTGVVLGIKAVNYVHAVRRTGIPTVMYDGWESTSRLDSVEQDGQMGAFLATRHLIEQGCRRIAWLGHTEGESHKMDRFGGMMGALDEAGMQLSPELYMHAELDKTYEQARRLLSLKKLPDGVVAPWQTYCRALYEVATEMGIVIGEQLRMVGWVTDEDLAAGFAKMKDGHLAYPMASWSVQSMAETAVARLAERRHRPDMPPLRLKIPMRLVT
jgi:DNA-binding LacI/PurR family transcriptional regulator